MSFSTDIVAINLRDYPHSPALLTDLAREGYELFNPDGHVFFRKHNRLASVPAAPAPETPVVAPDINYDHLAHAVHTALLQTRRPAPGQDGAESVPDADEADEEYGPECDHYDVEENDE